MAYTPELDLSTVRILRRIAWAMNVPMTVSLPSRFAQGLQRLSRSARL